MLGGGNTVYLVCHLAGLGSTVVYKVEHLPSRAEPPRASAYQYTRTDLS